MPTIVSETIGGTTPDYNTISIWESATDNDLVSADEVRIGLLRNDVHTGTTIAGATTDATRYRILTHDGVPHNGIFRGSGGTSAPLIQPNGAGHAMVIAEDNFVISGISISNGTSNSNECFRVQNTGLFTLAEIIGRQRNKTTTTNTDDDFINIENGATIVARNVVAYGFVRAIYEVDANSTITDVNCTYYNNLWIVDNFAATTVYNASSCLFHASGTSQSTIIATTVNIHNCISNDDSITTTTQSNFTLNATFTSSTAAEAVIFSSLVIDSEDLHLVDHANNLAKEYVPTSGIVLTYDFEYDTRPSDSAQEAGADELEEVSGDIDVDPTPIPVPIFLPSINATVTTELTPITIPLVIPFPLVSIDIDLGSIKAPILLPNLISDIDIDLDALSIPIILANPEVEVQGNTEEDLSAITIPIHIADVEVETIVDLTPIQIPLSLANPEVEVGINIIEDLTPIHIPVILPPEIQTEFEIIPLSVKIPIALPNVNTDVGNNVTVDHSPIYIPIGLPSLEGIDVIISPLSIKIPINLATVTTEVNNDIEEDLNAIKLPILLANPEVELIVDHAPIIIPINVVSPSVEANFIEDLTPIQIPLNIQSPEVEIELTPTPHEIRLNLPQVTTDLYVDHTPVKIPIVTQSPIVEANFIESLSPIHIPISLVAPLIDYETIITHNPIHIPIGIPNLTTEFTIENGSIKIPLVLVTPDVDIGSNIDVTPDPILIPIKITSPSVEYNMVVTPTPIHLMIKILSPTLDFNEEMLVPVRPGIGSIKFILVEYDE